jgi:hypothetical protein
MNPAPSMARYFLEAASIPGASCILLWVLFVHSPAAWVLAVFAIYGSFIGSVLDGVSDTISAAIRRLGQVTLIPSFGTALLFPGVGAVSGALLQNQVLGLMTSSFGSGMLVFWEVTVITPLLILVQLLAKNAHFRPKGFGDRAVAERAYDLPYRAAAPDS